ncbi:MAG: acireductone synthase [Acidobacteriota bacterium]
MNRETFSQSINTILLDIEGTTTPVDFVYQTLFPFARKHFKSYLEQNILNPEIQDDLKRLHQEQLNDTNENLAPPEIHLENQSYAIDSVFRYLIWLMDRDRKSPALKSLQGKIWEAGYRNGELTGEVFADVPVAFQRWHSQSKAICIYSSGSVLAQKLIFSHTRYGDLTRYISNYFDTAVGGKKATASYQQILRSLKVPPDRLLFISDVIEELDAARASGLPTSCSVRPGNSPVFTFNHHPMIYSFDEVFPDL